MVTNSQKQVVNITPTGSSLSTSKDCVKAKLGKLFSWLIITSQRFHFALDSALS